MLEEVGTIGKFTVYRDSTPGPILMGYKGECPMGEPEISPCLKYRNYFKLYLPKRLRKRAMKGKL
jgi:hypothetical protein